MLTRVGTTDTKTTTLTGGGATLMLPRASVWDVELRSDGWWAAPASITAGVSGAVDVWRTARVRGRVVVPKGTELPREITIAVERPPQRAIAASPPAASFPCTVAADGAFVCQIPAGMVDVAVRAKGFAPVYRWNVTVDPAKANDLATITLRKGGSLLAWLDRDSAGELAIPARARLIRQTSLHPSEVSARLSVPVAESDFSKRGNVQLTGLAPGAYALEVSAPGFAKTVMAPIEIYEGKETAIRNPIVLQRPVEVGLRIEPPADADSKPWRVQLQRRSDLGQPGTDAKVHATSDPTGIVRVPDQSPGRFRVEIEDSAGNRVFSDVVTFSGEPPDAHTIRVKQIRVTGTVTLGGRGIPAEVWFGGRDGAVRVTKRADEEGRFVLALPHAGSWLVETHAEPDVEARQFVQVGENGGEVTIDLPDASISGWVVDESGARVRRASVFVTAAGAKTAAFVETNGSGEFRIRGVAPGPATLGAAGRNESRSRRVTVQVPENGEVTGVELRVTDPGELQGQVLIGGTPVSGALVDVVTHRVTSDVDGRFTLKLPPEGARVPLTVAAAGRTFNTFAMPQDDRPLRLEIPATGGEIVVTLPAGVEFFELYQNQVAVFFNNLRQWVMAHGLRFPVASRAVLPNMAPGHYRACIPRQGKPPACAEGTLGAGGSLTLRVE
jgi:Carboxypeptidase regulatory-like domain